MSIYNIDVKTINGDWISLSDFKGKVLLIVNTASRCGLTSHYHGLQQLYSAFKEKGLVVLGFPCNQFANQEPGDEKEILTFCQTNYQLTFPMFAKVDVKGENAHPLFTYLVKNTPSPFYKGDIEWNFVKFLIGSDGKVIKQYPANTEPKSIQDEIVSLGILSM